MCSPAAHVNNSPDNCSFETRQIHELMHRCFCKMTRKKKMAITRGLVSPLFRVSSAIFVLGSFSLIPSFKIGVKKWLSTPCLCTVLVGSFSRSAEAPTAGAVWTLPAAVASASCAFSTCNSASICCSRRDLASCRFSMFFYTTEHTHTHKCTFLVQRQMYSGNYDENGKKKRKRYG